MHLCSVATKVPHFTDKENEILQRQSPNENPMLLTTFYHTWSHYITIAQKPATGPQSLTNNSEIQKAPKICSLYTYTEGKTRLEMAWGYLQY